MQKKGLSGYWLKVIAVITMLIDHTAATILEQMLMQLPEWGPIDNANWEQWYVLYLILRGVSDILLSSGGGIYPHQKQSKVRPAAVCFCADFRGAV